MLRELTKTDWLTVLGIPEGRIPRALLLRGTRNLKTQYSHYRQFFSNVVEVGCPNGIIEDVFIGDHAGQPVAYASVYGAAMASEVVHIFGVLGTPLSWALHPQLAIHEDTTQGDPGHQDGADHQFPAPLNCHRCLHR
jgi:hypothetical protein